MQFSFLFPLSSGLHARPASHLAEAAGQFASDCTLTNLRNGLSGNVKSVLSLIAADVRHHDRCILSVSGGDENAALLSLQVCVEQTLPKLEVPLPEVPAASGNGTIPRTLQRAGAACIPGISISRGIGQGKVKVVRRIRLRAQNNSPSASDPQNELARVTEGLTAVRQRIQERLKYAITPVGIALLEADLALASDVLLIDKLGQEISQGKSAAQAVVQTGEFFIDLLEHSESDYIRQRSADIEEICSQLLEEVDGVELEPSIELTEPSVLVAESLAPQQLLQLDRQNLKGLVLEASSTTSHATILARSLGIPSLAGVGSARAALLPGQDVVVDGNRGFVVAELSPGVIRFYEREHETLKRRLANSLVSPNHSGTEQRKPIEVAANASSGEEAVLAFENGADGIGLFRTEMIFLGREDVPSEDEQYAIYSEVVKKAASRPVIIRTFDIGGDKKVPYLNLQKEENPFLGFRGSRIYDERSDLLRAQLRAILRASVAGSVQIMAPMIASVEEVTRFQDAVLQAKKDLLLKHVEFREDVKIGIMIEIPAVAFALGELCPRLDFFSLGTNDLSQYFFAADRSNPKVSSLFSVQHPGFLRFLDQIVRQIHSGGKWAGICGEMASDPTSLPLLLGLGLDEISVPASEIGEFRRAASKWDSARCQNILKSALTCSTVAEVRSLLGSQPESFSPQPLLTNELVVLESRSQTKEEVIQEMVDAFYTCGRTNDRQTLEEALWAREAMGSTELGHGFAIPHCKTDAVAANSICVLRLLEPIHWNAGHDDRVRMVVLLALRDSDPANTHMQVFSSLARKLINDDFRNNLLGMRSADELTRYLSHQLNISVG